MAGLVPAIHVFGRPAINKTWMPGTRPGMTAVASLRDYNAVKIVSPSLGRSTVFGSRLARSGWVDARMTERPKSSTGSGCSVSPKLRQTTMRSLSAFRS